MRILGIETSCDETAAAVVEDGIKILSSVVSSSQLIHAKTGGIIPENAAREQIKSIIPVIEQALISAFPDLWVSTRGAITFRYVAPMVKEIDAIAVTYGPGLIGSLLVGVESAKTLSFLWDKPIVPVNHLLGHIYANFLTAPLPEFPLLALIVSGGHTDLVYMRDHPSTDLSSVELVGTTRDDAAGEAFDKCARLLGLPYPGGPSIAKAADEYLEYSSPKSNLTLFPRPIINDNSYDFSFSGLKTAVLRYCQENKDVPEKRGRGKSMLKIAAEIQEAIVDVLVKKTIRAAAVYKPKSILLSGGVAANNRLRKKIQDELISSRLLCHLHVPKIELCTDNAAVIASAAQFNFRPIYWDKVTATPNLTIENL